MAIKSTLFLLALVLFVSTMGSSVEDVDNLETENNHHHHDHHNRSHHYHHHHAKAPAHAPSKAPIHAPKKAPIVHAPIPPPPKAHHAYPPASPPHGCVGKCSTYCKTISPKRHCMKSCTACCDKCKCVPAAGLNKCTNWDNVMIHGYIVKCP